MKAQKSQNFFFQKYTIQTKSSAVVRGGSRGAAEPSKFWDSEKRTESETDNLSENETLINTTRFENYGSDTLLRTPS